MARKYELKKRAERQEETRLRIADAAVELHSTVGPSRTTIAAIAERAGVERLTVYRHFPDEYALFGACSQRGWETSPGPDPQRWLVEADPVRRLRLGLSELYGYFAEHRQLLSNLNRDADTMPAVRWAFQRFRAAFVESVRKTLLSAWPNRRSRKLQAVVGHATDFLAWRSLDDQGLDDPAKIDLMVLLAEAASTARPAPRGRASRASPSLPAAG